MRILTITTPDMENGLGCRVTLWFAGCSRHCQGCHNEHSWNYNQGKEFTSEEVQNKINELVSERYINGITLSGGDPLDQDNKSLCDLYDFLVNFKKSYPNKDIWIYSGGIFDELIKNENICNILKISDVLIDGPFVKELYDRDLAFRGSTNQRIIDLKSTFNEGIIKTINL